MKRAKLMLAGIACLAVVGGAFAFKANRAASNVFCPTTTVTSALATYRVPYTTVIIPGHVATTKPCEYTTKYGTTTTLPANLFGTVYTTVL